MRISGLSERTGLPVATLKYYLREGLVPPGRATSPNQARYDDTHVERVRLIRALTEVGGLDLATVDRVLSSIDGPDVERLGVLGSAQRALLGAEFVEYDPATADEPPTSRARDWVTRRGWQVDLHDPVLDALDRAWDACEASLVGFDEGKLGVYADAAERIAQIDVESVPPDPHAAVRQVVLGTVLVDALLVALRRLAQQHVAVSRHGDG
ncbi:MerR family transcriptional regulator [Mobilicoccus caccae]|uniref:MerR family transcriptional regulator n=1 Tax=Mobilicoccus caccae TaxID=1859295 RepID=A0ABQ6IKL4_9MICO|nr:MerR family transcriptional regulator [Mobilicoccus caccae]GMA37986.1 MerR family transcriptional regulator [Mobilicoccus caccae]GMA42369.1 MerR family transcriptional regulator [Mobilicoccus caccae]GMA42518.1 MerR family transcriptional regulator [Mobilicoccus caccae]